jgi:hypothetical protein
LQFVGFTTRVGQGVELLNRGLQGKDRDYFVRAAQRFEEGIADIKTALSTMDGERMLENASQVQHLLRAAALCAAGEMQAMVLSETDMDSRIASLRSHRELWTQVGQRLRQLPGPASRLPTAAMLKTEREQGLMTTRRRWTQEAQQMLEIIEAEVAFLQAAQTLLDAEPGAGGKGTTGAEDSPLCLVRIQAAAEG